MSQASSIASVRAGRWRETAGGLVVRLRWVDPWLLLAIAVGAALRLMRLGDFHNLYYTATAASMLQSPHNFLFGSFDPLGVVTVDKPPFAFWVQAVPAAIFWPSGVTVSIPQAMAGIGAIVLLYAMVKPAFGRVAAVAAALTLAVLPASVVIDAGNEPDGLLSFTLLLSAFCVIRAVQTGRWLWLAAFAVLMGMGFNIKMLVAFVPLPAFVLYYALTARGRVRAVAVRVAVALAVVAVVSLSWATFVALTPAEQRPYIGSTRDNSIWTLVFKYNGLDRFRSFGLRARAIPQPQPQQPLVQPNAQPNVPAQQAPQVQPQVQAGATPFTGVFGMFTNPLAGQLGWLLPLGVVALLAALAPLLTERVFRKPLATPSFLRETPAAAQTVLWVGWLLTAVVVFGLADATTTHPYYLVGVAVPLAATLGIGLATLWRAFRDGTPLAWLLPLAMAGAALYQAFVARTFVADWTTAVLLVGTLLAVLGMSAAAWRKLAGTPLAGASVAAGALALLAVPLVFALSLGGAKAGPAAGLPGPPPAQQMNPEQQRARNITAFIKRQTDSGAALATVNAREAAPFIVAGQKAFAVGGFSGNDPIFNPRSLREMAERGELRYFLMPGQGGPTGPGGRPPQVPVLDYVRREWKDVSLDAGLPFGTLYHYQAPR